MEMYRTKLIAFFIGNLLAFAGATFSQYNSDKVLLSDVKAITLHQGKMTNARRSSPVPQLKCVGGSAQHRFQPKVVQCINQGSDGYDIQWECKTDMDNSYTFGRVEVSCEGYDYPNDPYVLKGSCGLEYTVDFTEEGVKREKERNGGSYNYNNYDDGRNKSEGGLGGLFVFGCVAFAIYVIYKTCLAPQARNSNDQTHHNQSTPSAPPPPPPYGFKPEFTHSQGAPPPYAPPSYESSTGGNPAYDRPNSSSQQASGGGFWTGAATGGLLGYLFGSQNNRGYNQRSGWGSHHNSHHAPRNSWGFSSNSSPTSSRSSSSSSGSRMTSGFGGTSRR